MGIALHRILPGGQFVKDKGIRSANFPGFVIVKKTGQQYSLIDNPLHPEGRVLFSETRDGKTIKRPFRTEEEFLTFEPPPVFRDNDKSIMVVKDDDPLPISVVTRTPAEENVVRSNIHMEGVQDGLNAGIAEADRVSQAFYSLFLLTLAGVTGFSTVVIGILFVLGKVGR